MEHFYKTFQKFTFFNYQDIYKRMIEEASSDARFAEIGVWKGQSVAYAAVEIINSGKNIKIDAIDTWEGSPGESQIMDDPSIINKTLYSEFLDNIRPVAHVITPLKMESRAAALTFRNHTFDFVFIDGSHTYEAAYNDIAAWLPKVKRGGYIGGHDYDGDEEFNGVAAAVRDHFRGERIEVYNLGWASWLKRVI